jgi:putative spermidine/putrescine transport system substrate-binding protein
VKHHRSPTGSALKRRSLLGAAAALPALGVLRSRGAMAQAPREIRMIDAGGLSGRSIQAGYIEPFTRKTGTRVVQQSPNPLGRLVAMVEANVRDTVIYDLPSAAMRTAATLGLIEPINWPRVAPAPMFTEARHDFGFGHQFFSTVMCWRKGVKPLASWADFFNTRDFPGPRAVPAYPNFALAFALLGSGVRPANLFPLDVEAALARLTAIKDDVAVWWKSGESPPELLRSNDIHYAIAWSGRIAGDPLIDFTFVDGMLDMSYFTIVKGASNEDKAAAWQLLHEASLAENQARAAAVVSYTGPSPDLEALLPRDKLDQYPTIRKNKDVQWLQDADWWEANGARVGARWEEFLDSL